MLVRDNVTMLCAHAWGSRFTTLTLCVCLSRALINNQITTLPAGVFQSLTSLQVL
jgi:hypothetical protein